MIRRKIEKQINTIKNAGHLSVIIRIIWYTTCGDGTLIGDEKFICVYTVNSEQLLFNWQLGRDLVIQKAEEKWGKGIVEQLSLDFQNEFPDVKGFSARNLWNMKKWYLFYSSDSNFIDMCQELENKINLHSLKLHQIGAEINEDEMILKRSE